MKKVAIAIVAVVLLLIVAGVFFRGKGNGKNDKDTSAVVEKGRLLSQVVETGSLEAKKVVDLKSRVAGRIAKLLVDEGDVVKSGQLVAVIDPEETQLRVAQDQARLKGAVAMLDRQKIEITQRKVTANSNLQRAKSRVAQIKDELTAQPTFTKSDVDSAETAYNNAVNARDLLIKVTQPNEKTSVANQLAEAQANYESAKADLERNEFLLTKGYVSQRALDDAKSRFTAAQSRLDTIKNQSARLESEQAIKRDQAEESVRQAKAGFDRASANTFRDQSKKQEYDRAVSDLQDAQAAMLDLQSLEAGKTQQEANVQQIQNSLNDSLRELRETEIRAPFDGIVSKRFVQVGELVASLSSFSSGSPVFRIEDRSSMIVKLQINEIDVAKLSSGMTAKIVVDAFGDKTFAGKVTKISPASTAAAAAQAPQGDSVVKYAVEVEMTDPDSVIKSGMSAKCTMTILDKDGVLTLPRQFVGKEKDGKYFVMLAPKDPKDKKSKPTKAIVQVGDSSGTSYEIVSGVKVGQKVVKPEYTGPDRKGMMQFGDDDGADAEASKDGEKKTE